MKKALWFLPLLGIVAGLTLSGFTPKGGDSCPDSNNACTNLDGCPAGNKTVYIDWVGMRRCTFGFEGCENNLSLLCKIVHSVVWPCGEIETSNYIYECGCADNGYANPIGHGACSTEGPGR